jgi:hypothetical protein
MMTAFKGVMLAVLAVGSVQALRVQDLSPRADIITAIHSNAVTLT